MSSETKTGVVEIWSVDHLIDILTQEGIDIGEWGTGKYKSVQELYEEIKAGETILAVQDGELVRQLAVVNIDVFYCNSNGQRCKLKETVQVWHDGTGRYRFRDRSSSVAEKLKHDENPGKAAIRGMLEELKIECDDTELVFKEKNQSQEESPSYPGITSQYTFFVYEITLTDDCYQPEGYIEDDGSKSTYFEWELVDN